MDSAARWPTGPNRQGYGTPALGRAAIESEGVVHEHFNTNHYRHIAATHSEFDTDPQGIRTRRNVHARPIHGGQRPRCATCAARDSADEEARIAHGRTECAKAGCD